jgi:protein-disulfide isomerase
MKAYCLLLCLSLLSFMRLSAQCPSNITIPPSGFGFAPGAHVTVYADTSDPAIAAEYSNIATGIYSWNTVNAVTYSIYPGLSGYSASTDPQNPTWAIKTDPNPTATNNGGAQTGPSNGLSGVIQDGLTRINQSAVNSGNVQNLMVHETTHPNWNWECQSTTAGACNAVASNTNGNTQSAPTACDISATRSNTYKGPSSSISQSDDGTPTTCSDNAPCPGASCDNGLWNTTSCQAVPSTQCYDDPPCTNAQCVGTNIWDTSSCGSVSTAQCDDASPCDGAVCVSDNTWDTSQCTDSDCPDVCDTDCSDYDYDSCYGSGDDGGGGSCECQDDYGNCTICEESFHKAPGGVPLMKRVEMYKPIATETVDPSLLGMPYSQTELGTKCVAPPDKTTQAVTQYVFEKNHVANASQLTLVSSGPANDDCYWRYRYQIGPAQREITLYLAPDHRYLTPVLFDSNSNPLVEEKAQREAVARSLSSSTAASRGKKDATVTIVEFSDFECPYCQHLTDTLERDILPSDPDVRVVFRNFPLSMHPWAQQAAEIAACAQMQSDVAFWKLHDYIFANQRGITPANINDRLMAVVDADTTVERDAFHSCVERGLTMGPISKDVALGKRFGVRSTPTFFVNGFRVEGFRDAAQLKELIDDARSGKQGPSFAGETGPSAKNVATAVPSTASGDRCGVTK